MDNTQKKPILKIACLECESPIVPQNDLKIGTVVECLVCGSQSEVVTLLPLKLSVIEEEK